MTADLKYFPKREILDAIASFKARSGWAIDTALVENAPRWLHHAIVTLEAIRLEAIGGMERAAGRGAAPLGFEILVEALRRIEDIAGGTPPNDALEPPSVVGLMLIEEVVEIGAEDLRYVAYGPALASLAQRGQLDSLASFFEELAGRARARTWPFSDLESRPA